MLSETGHRGIADSLSYDEIELGVRELLHISRKHCHRRVKIRFKSIATAAVDPMTSGTVRLVLFPCRLEIFRRSCEGIRAGESLAMDPAPQNVTC